MQDVKTERRLLWVFALLLLLVLPTSVALAAPLAQREVGDDDVVYGDVVLFDEDFDLKEGGSINGDVIIFNGTATISGTVHGDLVLFNGDLAMSDTAVLNGDCVLFNGATTGDGSVNCTNLNVELPQELVNFLGQLDIDPEPVHAYEAPSFMDQFLGGTAAAIARAVLFGLLAFAAASLLPQPMQRIENTLRQRPVASGAIGMLTTFSMPFVALTLALISIPLILLCGLGLLGYPLIGVMILAMVAAGFLGWFTVGNIVGEFLAQKLNMKSTSQAMTTALGTVAITFTIGFLGAIPFVIGEGLIWLLIVFLGLGATTLTKFGTREYPFVAVAPAPLNQDKITAVLDTLPDKEDLTD